MYSAIINQQKDQYQIILLVKTLSRFKFLYMPSSYHSRGTYSPTVADGIINGLLHQLSIVIIKTMGGALGKPHSGLPFLLIAGPFCYLPRISASPLSNLVYSVRVQSIRSTVGRSF